MNTNIETKVKEMKSERAEKINRQDDTLERKMAKYSTGTVRVREQRANFLFLTNGTLVYNYDCFADMESAIIDAVKNHGEDLDEMIDLCYSQTNSRLLTWFTEQLNK